MWLYGASLASNIFFLPLPFTHTHTPQTYSFNIFAKCPLPYKRARGRHQELSFDLQKYRQNSNTIQGQKGIRKDLRDSCRDQGKGESIRWQDRWRTAYQSVLNPIKRRNEGKDKLGGYLVEGKTWVTEILCGKGKFIDSNASRSMI